MVLKYEQIADNLRRRIAAGEFGPGDLLPSGRDLCEQWQVSRATVNKALDLLRADGLVLARQGYGFYVTDTPIGRPAGQRGAGSARVTGGMPFRRLGTPTWEHPPAHIAEALDLQGDVLALRRARLMLLEDGGAHSLATAWFPPDVAGPCPRLSQDGPIAEGTTHYISQTIGRSPVRGTDVTTVRLATDDEAEQLGVEQPAAVAVVLHAAFDKDGRALVCEEGVTPAALWERIDNYPMGPRT